MLEKQIINTDRNIQNKSKEIEKLEYDKSQFLQIKENLSKQINDSENFENFENIKK